ncbi:hypothetical protein [uncultured Clostridium sp.]|jgi:hypothetical protein|uniref:hypothetical protein n=1 Tax=uncultured Clostridium sp. TaxID=59620 RepID=UPI003217B5E6
MSNDLIVRCFLENARLEGKNVTMSCDNTYEVVDLNNYNIVKNKLVVNDKVLDIRDVYENRDGYFMRIGEWELVVN